MPDEFARQLAHDLDPGDMRQVLEVFDADIARLRDRLLSLADIGDVAAFQRIAHQIAGAAGALGAGTLEGAARQAMERAGLAPATLPAVAAEIASLAREALRMSRELRAHLV